MRACLSVWVLSDMRLLAMPAEISPPTRSMRHCAAAAAAAAVAAIYKIDDHRVCRSGQTRWEGPRRTMDGGWMEDGEGQRPCCHTAEQTNQGEK